MSKIILTVAILSLSAAPVVAAHANPWATEDDVVLMKEHESNQARSIGTPGTDEMHGHQVQNVSPNAGQGAANGGAGQGGNPSAGAGFGGNGGGDGGGNGHGGGNR